MRKDIGYLMMSVFLFTLAMLFVGCSDQRSNMPNENSDPIQVIQVVDINTGQPVSGVQIAVSDDIACYLPKTTGTNGSVTFSTQGIQTIFASCPGYANFTVSPMMSFASYKISLNPLPSNPTNNILLSETKAITADMLTIAKIMGLVTPLGRYSLKQINTALDWASDGTFFACIIPTVTGEGAVPCAVVGFIVGLPTAVGSLAELVGVPDSQLFDFYLVNFGSPQIIMIPVQ